MIRTRVALTIRGIVQGVGFRPFLFRLAGDYGLAGWVSNQASEVVAEFEGSREMVWDAVRNIRESAPPASDIREISALELTPAGYTRFEIRPSRDANGTRGNIPPDLAICPDCRRELEERGGRRYRHPFISCTNCGPRYTIIRNVPYDRPVTTMAGFSMCSDCQQEYSDPTDRRHHAQPIACNHCGPILRFVDSFGCPIKGDPIEMARLWLRRGRIVAVQGLGGFHLACLATRPRAVRALRARKGRDSRPFAVMVHDLAQARTIAHVDSTAERALAGAPAPIVLLPPNDSIRLAPQVNGGSPVIGVMLAYTPLHILLTRGMPPLVMTSGNRSGEPIVAEASHALEQLRHVADGFLIHDRPIERRCDDSVVRVASGEPRLVRRGRGFVPGAIALPALCRPLIALGAEQKGAFCLASENQAILSPHIGDLKEQATVEHFTLEIHHMGDLLGIKPQLAVCDRHPDYFSTHLARTLELPIVHVQHHHAHIASVLAENGLYGQVIGVAMDGSGLGEDGNVWGGEFLIATARSFERLGHLHEVRMPGGDRAVLEPWRMAGAYLETFCQGERRLWPSRLIRRMERGGWPLLWQAAVSGIGAPLTSSVGRLFDAVSCLLGLCDHAGYEGEAAVRLEALARPDYRGYHFGIEPSDEGWVADPGPAVLELLSDLKTGMNIGDISGRFHLGLAEMIGTMCRLIREKAGINDVALSGGVFDNQFLLRSTIRILEQGGMRVLLNRMAPANDGGIALGQALVAAMRDGRCEEGDKHVPCHTWPGE